MLEQPPLTRAGWALLALSLALSWALSPRSAGASAGVAGHWALSSATVPPQAGSLSRVRWQRGRTRLYVGDACATVAWPGGSLELAREGGDYVSADGWHLRLVEGDGTLTLFDGVRGRAAFRRCAPGA